MIDTEKPDVPLEIRAWWTAKRGAATTYAASQAEVDEHFVDQHFKLGDYL